MPLSYRQRTLQLVKTAGILRPRDLAKHRIPRQYLRLLEHDGKIQRSGRGLYTLAAIDPGENYSLAQACKRVPHGVICLLSALRLHHLTTQLPHEVWMALPGKSRKPSMAYPPLRIVRFSAAALRFGLERRQIQGVTVHVYNPAKTVADCFKYRHKIGLDVALEALRDCRAPKMATIDDLWAAAKICRVANVMRPYMEALAHVRTNPPTCPR